MLPRRNKLSRASFPHHREPKFSWSGKVLRIYAYYKDSYACKVGGEENLLHHKSVDCPQAGGTHNGAITPRFAIVIPKRLSANAVLRNAFKRQVMVAIGESMACFERLSYKKYVIFPITHVRRFVAGQVMEDLETFFEKLQKK